MLIVTHVQHFISRYPLIDISYGTSTKCTYIIGVFVRWRLERLFLKFADAIDGAHERMSHDELFEACSNTTPSEIGK